MRLWWTRVYSLPFVILRQGICVMDVLLLVLMLLLLIVVLLLLLLRLRRDGLHGVLAFAKSGTARHRAGLAHVRTLRTTNRRLRSRPNARQPF